MSAEVSTLRSRPESNVSRPTGADRAELPRWAALSPRVAGVFGALVGTAVLVGWVLHADALKRVLPGQVSMKPNTAFSFVLLGVALLLLAPRSAGGRRRLVGRGLAVVVALVGLLTLGEQILGWNLGIDQVLFHEPPGDVLTTSPGRMSPATMVGFVALGGGVALLNARRPRVRRLLALMLALLFVFSLAVVTAHLYGAEFLYLTGGAGYTPMAFHTAVAFLALTFGARLARPALGLPALAMSPGPAGVIVRRLVPGAVVSLLALGFLRLRAEDAGVFGPEAGTALFVVAVIATSSLVIAATARSVERVDRLRRRAEEEAQGSEERIRSIVEVAPDAVVVVDADGRIILANSAAAAMFGFPADELVGLVVESLLPERLTQAHIAHRYAYLRHPSTRPMRAGLEFTARRKDGSEFPVEVALGFLGTGKVPAVVSIIRDITERRRAEEELARLATIVEGAGDAIYSKTLEGTLTTWNRGAEILFGYPAAEAIGRPISIIVPADRQDEITGILERVRRGELIEHYEAVRRCKDGRLIDVSVSVSPLKGADGSVKGSSVISRDITERRRAEERLARQRVELERSNADLERFSYVASHDLQEPLRMVSNFVSLLGQRYRGRLDEDADEFIGFAVDGATRMSAMINDLLAYSRAGGAREAQPVDCEEALVRATRNLAAAIGESGAVVTHDPLPTVTAEPLAMTQVFQNLISNAIKFRRDGQAPRIHVGARRERDECVLSVEDNGIGIDPADQERVFEIFRRLHARDRYAGTGIGLAICQRIVHLHGGRIWLESEAGAGSTFSFALPAAGTEEGGT